MEILNQSYTLERKKNNLNISKLLALLALVFFLGAAFYFSAQPASISKLQSGEVLSWVHRLGFENVTMHFIRKFAHFTLFAGVAMAFSFALSFKLSGVKLFLSSFLSAAFIGLLNETHQMFVPGRGPQIKDVMINASGAFLGALCLCSMIYLLHKRQNLSHQ